MIDRSHPLSRCVFCVGLGDDGTAPHQDGDRPHHADELVLTGLQPEEAEREAEVGVRRRPTEGPAVFTTRSWTKMTRSQGHMWPSPSLSSTHRWFTAEIENTHWSIFRNYIGVKDAGCASSSSVHAFVVFPCALSVITVPLFVPLAPVLCYACKAGITAPAFSPEELLKVLQLSGSVISVLMQFPNSLWLMLSPNEASGNLMFFSTLVFLFLSTGWVYPCVCAYSMFCVLPVAGL